MCECILWVCSRVGVCDVFVSIYVWACMCMSVWVYVCLYVCKSICEIVCELCVCVREWVYMCECSIYVSILCVGVCKCEWVCICVNVLCEWVWVVCEYIYICIFRLFLVYDKGDLESKVFLLFIRYVYLRSNEYFLSIFLYVMLCIFY